MRPRLRQLIRSWEPRSDNVASALLLALIQRFMPETPVAPLASTDRLDGASCLITGANSGLGKAAAIALARRGARVIMACRSQIPEAGEDVRQQSGSDAVEMRHVDLADLRTVDRLCDELRDRGEVLERLIVNAAVMPKSARRTVQGYELIFGVNYLAHALLVQRLLADGIIADDPQRPVEPPVGRPRIVIVSSEAHRSAKPLDFATLGEFVDYGVLTGMAQYAHSKLLLVTLAQELARRLRADDGPTVAVHSLCPGAVATNIAREAPTWLKPTVDAAMRSFFASPERAITPVEYLACATAIEGETGLYLHRRTVKAPSAEATDPAKGARLWDATTRLLARPR